VSSFCLLVAGLSVGVVLGELRDQLHLSGVIAAAHGATFGVGLLVVGLGGLPVIARFGRHRVFVASCLAILVGVLVLCAGQSWPVTLSGVALAGFACAFLVMLMPGILADHHGDHMASAFAAVNGFPGIAGIMFSLVVGGALGLGWTWRWAYAALTIVIAAVVVVTGRGVRMPDGAEQHAHVLALFKLPEVRGPWLGIVHAVLVEFSVGVFTTVYLKEVGGASGGLAATLAGLWGLSIFLSRLWMPRFVARFGPWSRSVGFLIAGVGVTLMWTGPGLAVRSVGLVIAGLGGGVLYPLAVEQLYVREGGDTVSLGAVAALASGTAVTLGPMSTGILADAVSVRHALLFVPVLAVIGVVANAPSRRRQVAPA
jgi:MFS family permease